MWTWPNLFHNRSCGCSQSTQVLRNRLRRFPNSMPTVRSSLSASTQTVGFAGAAPRSMVQHTLWHALDMLRLFYAFWHWGSQLVTFSCAKHSERSSSDRQHSSWKTLKGKGWKGHERSNDVSTIFATIQPGHQRVLYFNQFNYFAIAVYSGIARWHWKVAARFQDLAFSGIRLHSVAFGSYSKASGCMSSSSVYLARDCSTGMEQLVQCKIYSWNMLKRKDRFHVTELSEAMEVPRRCQLPWQQPWMDGDFSEKTTVCCSHGDRPCSCRPFQASTVSTSENDRCPPFE